MSHESKMRTKLEEVKQGAVIYQEKPFVYTLSSKFRTDHCDFCFATGKLSKCSGCRYVYYCGRACQKEGWSVHKLECSNLNKIAPRVIPDAARLIAKLIKKLQKGGDQIKSYYTETNYRTYKDLMSHYPDIKKDQRRMEHLSSLYGVLYEFLGNEMIPNSAELMGMYGRMCVNCYSICNPELQSLGTGMYLGASVIDHSCKPNALATFEGTTLYIRTLVTLPYLDWSNIFISYIDELSCTKDRRAELQSTYYFFCECARCLAPEPYGEMTGAACPNSNCDNFIENNATADDSCSKCGAIVTEQFLAEFHEVMELTIGHLDTMKQITYLDVCKVCLKKHEGLLYKYNLKHLKVLDLAFEGSIDFQKFDDAKILGLKLMDGYYKYYGEMHPLTGLLHLKLGKILVFQNCIEEAKEHVMKSSNILQVTHGRKSSIFRQELLPLLHQISMESS